jgi:hypothetical protein
MSTQTQNIINRADAADDVAGTYAERLQRVALAMNAALESESIGATEALHALLRTLPLSERCAVVLSRRSIGQNETDVMLAYDFLGLRVGVKKNADGLSFRPFFLDDAIVQYADGTAHKVTVKESNARPETVSAAERYVGYPLWNVLTTALEKRESVPAKSGSVAQLQAEKSAALQRAEQATAQAEAERKRAQEAQELAEAQAKELAILRAQLNEQKSAASARKRSS